MIEAMNAADAVEALDKWMQEYELVLSLNELSYVREFTAYLKSKGDKGKVTPVGATLAWTAAELMVAKNTNAYTLSSVEALHATFERMAYSVFPADFAAEATRLVRNEPKRASDPTLERIADALECLALGAMAVAPNSDKSREFLDIAGGAAVRVMANAARPK